MFPRVKRLWSRIVSLVMICWGGLLRCRNGLGWLMAQAVRLAVSVRTRQAVCRKVTEEASKAVAKSYTVRVVYVASTLYCMFSNRLPVAAALIIIWVLAETVWSFVLYTAALICRLDDGLAEAKRRVEEAAQRTVPDQTTAASVPA